MSMKFKVVIAGSRNWTNRHLLWSKCDHLLQDKENIQVISGTARGADRMGEEWAHGRGHDVVRVPADWTKWGKRAGYVRNCEMADIADAVVVFWDGESSGSKMMINIAKDRGLPLRVIRG